MIPPSRLSSAWHRHFAGSVACMLLLRLALTPANHHHTHTCTSICLSCRLAQVLPLDWLSTCHKVNVHTSKHFRHFFLKLQNLFFSYYICQTYSRTYTDQKHKGVIYFIRLSICLLVSGNSLWFQAQHCNDDVCTHSLISSSASLLLLSRVSL